MPPPWWDYVTSPSDEAERGTKKRAGADALKKRGAGPDLHVRAPSAVGAWRRTDAVRRFRFLRSAPVYAGVEAEAANVNADERQLASHEIAASLERYADDVEGLLHVVFAAERAVVEDEHAVAVEAALLRTAIRFRDHSLAKVRPGLWSALRKWATLVDESRVESVLEFMRDEDDASTIQIGLQCIQSVYYSNPPRSAVMTMTDRVRVLTTAYLCGPVLVTAEMRALAANAVVAHSLLAPPEATLLAERVRSLRRAGLRSLVASSWSEIVIASGNPELSAALDVLRT